MEAKLNWKEKYAAIIVLTIAIVGLAAQVISILSSRATFITPDGQGVVYGTEVLAGVRTFAVVVICTMGGILLLAKKQFGWILSLPIIFLFLLLTGWATYATWKQPGAAFYSSAAGFAILLLAFLFLLTPSAIKKFKVGKLTFLPTLVFLLLLVALFWYLQ